MAGLADFASSALQFGEQLVLGNEEQHRASDAAGRAQDFSAQQAQINRDFQAHRYQTTVADMKAAGLNPMLAYSQGANISGAPASGGVQAETPHMQVAPALTSTAAQVRLLDEQADQVRADADLKRAQEKETVARTPTYAVSMDQMRAQIEQAAASVRKMQQETLTSEASAGEIRQRTENLRAQVPQIQATIDNLRAMARLAGAQTVQSGAQTRVLTQEEKNVAQRVAANLPELEAAWRQVQNHLQKLELPRAGMDAAANSSFAGAVGALFRALNPFLENVKK